MITQAHTSVNCEYSFQSMSTQATAKALPIRRAVRVLSILPILPMRYVHRQYCIRQYNHQTSRIPCEYNHSETRWLLDRIRKRYNRIQKMLECRDRVTGIQRKESSGLQEVLRMYSHHQYTNLRLSVYQPDTCKYKLNT